MVGDFGFWLEAGTKHQPRERPLSRLKQTFTGSVRLYLDVLETNSRRTSDR